MHSIPQRRYMLRCAGGGGICPTGGLVPADALAVLTAPYVFVHQPSDEPRRYSPTAAFKTPASGSPKRSRNVPSPNTTGGRVVRRYRRNSRLRPLVVGRPESTSEYPLNRFAR
eukprot:86707-Prorocentrum_minimum.AAC.2